MNKDTVQFVALGTLLAFTRDLAHVDALRPRARAEVYGDGAASR